MNRKQFHLDVSSYYSGLPNHLITNQKRTINILCGYTNAGIYEISLYAMFLDIPANELINLRLPQKSEAQRFDEEVHRLREEGLSYYKIAEQLDSNYATVRFVDTGRFGTHHLTTYSTEKH